MWVYKRDTDTREYEVGYYIDSAAYSAAWQCIESFPNEKDARKLVNYLNGGKGD